MVPRLFLFAGVCVLVAALWAAQDVLIPIALAVLFTFLLAPAVRKLERWRVPHAAAVMTVVTATLLIVVALGWVIAVQVGNLYDNLPSYRDEIIAKVQRVATSLGGESELSRLGDELEDAARGKPTSQPATAPATQATAPPAAAPNARSYEAGGRDETYQTVDDPGPSLLERTAERMVGNPKGSGAPAVSDTPTTAPTTQQAGTSPESPLFVAPVVDRSPIESLGLYLAPLLGPFATAGIVFVFVIFMLLQREDLRDRIIRLMGRTQLHVTTTALNDAATRISRYMMAQAIVNGTYGLAIAIGLYFIGQFAGDKPFPSFVLWGLLCALLRFIPYVGPWVAAAFPIVLSLAVYPGFGVFFWTAGMFVVVELASNNLMEPWLYGTSTGMSTLAVLISAVFWTWLWGPVGLLLATPMTVCLVVLGKHVPQLQFLDVMLGDEPVLDPPARVYQRLLAQDQEEATDLVTGFHAEMELLELYDTVLMPALALCESDRHAGQLDEARQRYIHVAMRDIIEETADQARLKQLREQATGTVERAKGNEAAIASGPAEAGAGNGRTAANDRCKVMSLPASDEADELVGLMLSQLLDLRGYVGSTMSINALAAEMIERVAEMNPDVVVVSALPPSATTRARYLCKRLHARATDRPMLVGLWTVTGDLKRAKERLTCVASVQVVTTLVDAVEQIRQLTHTSRVNRTPVEQGV
jgi:predicted PurR-regulated permease PerM/methylmalonyl-CoA mutase cobalamin-binding subunit